MSDSHHDLGNTHGNISITVGRDEFEPSTINPEKMVASVEIPHAHLNEIFGVSAPDFLGVEGRHITAIEPHRAEGLPTGAVLGMVTGTTKDGVFSPLPTDKSTSHIDQNGDTNIYTATFSGRNGTPSHGKINYRHPADTKYADKNSVVKKVENWSDMTPEDAKKGFSIFTGSNMSGQNKAKAAVKKGSALHRMIENNQHDSKFKRTVGEIRSISHSETAGEAPEDFSIIDAGTASDLSEKLADALTLKGPIVGAGVPTVKLVTDREVVESGSCPITASFTLHRGDQVEEVLRSSAAEISPSGSATTITATSTSLAQKVFEGEKNVVSIKEEDGSD